jgi:hypothetical protein
VPERRGDGGYRGLVPQGSGAARAVVRCAPIRQRRQSSSPRAGKGNAPGRQAQESQGAVGAEKSADGYPNRRRDKTPEAKPLSAAMPQAPKARQTPLIREGPVFIGRADESIPADDQSRGGVNTVGFMSAERGKVANRRRGCRIERTRRSLLGHALQGLHPGSAPG